MSTIACLKRWRFGLLLAVAAGALLVPLAHAASSEAGNAGRIAFVKCDLATFSVCDIFTMRPDGSKQVQLTTSGNENAAPSWSPDGRKIAYESADSGVFQIWVMNSDGSGKTQLTSDLTDHFRPGWSPNGKRIAYVSEASGSRNVWVMQADGSGQTQVTHETSPSVLDYQPVFMGANRILFTRADTGPADTSSLWSVKTDGSRLRQLIPDSLALNPAGASYSDRGEGRIAFYSNNCNACGPSQIYTMNADGTHIVRVENDTGYGLSPTWSPDGMKLAFWFAPASEDTSDVYTMNADGKNVVNVTNDPSIYNIEPNWGGAGKDV
jgi:Tol biopolymer transport system component